MNFKRIELIFFIAFIVLDIFLFASYVQNDDILVSTTSPANEDTTTSIMKSIRDDQISYGDLSNKKNEGFYIASSQKDTLKEKAPVLQGLSWSYYDHKVTVAFENSVKIKDEKQPQETLNAVMKDSSKVIEGRQYTYNKSLSNKSVVVFTQMIKGYPVYTANGQVRFTIRNGYATGYTQGMLENVEFLHEKRPVISQKRAVIWLYQYNKLLSNSSVQWVRLGYTKLLSVNDSLVYIPTWTVAVKSNSTGNVQYRRINGFTGATMDD
ncbi:two-component system regulatory protein YycI [Liquorilactobacillus oeni]|uniref:YycH family protein n=1 Tax=Liquorilactobacillus oeni DSM 19972 TaxID=1423777 RepID=A0A0R1MKB6_9LACO|nr:two-component system regulatory protein YycI [Liquorilactobacillus oeni]KRL05829.1 YycH family protein [Liquorilactobacillus oeni DSM 19972]